ncbi:phospholipase A2, minor isoenzyme-like [Bufo gargarizans]|uniref:phospholipase A2, minor isoenzyme-like n=1 Tax=Bufo gargarizans TaxID=30331 RepID=UPI001CF0DA1D|nr:phospholipase A2, minor isoenzyme-like [Bufo gargarizans]
MADLIGGGGLLSNLIINVNHNNYEFTCPIVCDPYDTRMYAAGVAVNVTSHFSTVSLVSALPQTRNLVQFRSIIKCIIPNSHPLNEYNGYGCYCGFGGSGNPVDELDRCCQVHDDCYSQYKSIKNCDVIFDNPYTEFYSYTCTDNAVTCNSSNNPCEMHICECDKNAAFCFSKASYNEEYKNMDGNKHCK